MEADWEIEIGGNAPLIEARWPGFVDLNRHPEKARDLTEALQFEELAVALTRLNGRDSPVWTTKCDVWPTVDFDPDEMDSPHLESLLAVACYIDLLPRDPALWLASEDALQWCKRLCARVRCLPLRSCRADLVVRGLAENTDGCEVGVTAYLSACSVTEAEAQSRLASALAVFTDAVATYDAPSNLGKPIRPTVSEASRLPPS
jgi:hypothetical protein